MTNTQWIGLLLLTAASFQVIGMLVGARWESWRRKKLEEAFRRDLEDLLDDLRPKDYVADDDKVTPIFHKRQAD